ncbi:MAG: hypothetical protein ACOZCL_09935 [Bacillota bacterium]
MEEKNFIDGLKEQILQANEDILPRIEKDLFILTKYCEVRALELSSTKGVVKKERTIGNKKSTGVIHKDNEAYVDY